MLQRPASTPLARIAPTVVAKAQTALLSHQSQFSKIHGDAVGLAFGLFNHELRENDFGWPLGCPHHLTSEAACYNRF